MVTFGVVDISIEVRNEAGDLYNPASAVIGTVKNSLGVTVATLQSGISLTNPSTGVYQALAYDVSDTTLYGDGFIVVDWATSDVTATFSYSSRIYYFAPIQQVSHSMQLLTWQPDTENIRGYRVDRQLPDEDTFTEITFTSFPFYVDEEEYASEEIKQAALWNIESIIWDPVAGGEEYSRRTISTADILFTPMPSQPCLITGSVHDVMGRAAEIDTVMFYVHSKDMPMNLASRYYLRNNEIAIPVDQYGRFAIPLVRGLLVTCEIAGAGVAFRFVVPDQPHALISSLEQYPLEMYRAQ